MIKRGKKKLKDKTGLKSLYKKLKIPNVNTGHPLGLYLGEGMYLTSDGQIVEDK